MERVSGVERVSLEGDDRVITFRVHDLDGLLGRIEDENLEVVRGHPETAGSEAELHDPAGNTVRLFQPAAQDGVITSDSPYVRTIDEEPGRRRRRWAVWAPLILVAVLAVAAVMIIQQPTGGTRQTAASNTHSPSPTSSPRSSSTLFQRRVIDLDHPLAGITAGWELFALGSGHLMHLRFADGRIVVTDVPLRGPEKPQSMIVGPDSVLVQSRGLANYIIPDGDTAHTPPAKLVTDSFGFPGPRPGTTWQRTKRNPINVPDSNFLLMNFDGRILGGTINSPPGPSTPLVGDGRGNILFRGIGGIYLGTPDGLHKVTSGKLLAVGPSRFLVLECDQRSRCSRVVINRASGTRRPLPGDLELPEGTKLGIGVISPDGSKAAIIRNHRVITINLRTGATHSLVRIDYPARNSLVFSPDGQWLFLVSSGTLLAYRTESWPDPTTWHYLAPDVELPDVSKLAIRPATA